MNSAFRQSFLKDVKKIKTNAVLRQIEAAIDDVDAADRIEDIRSIKKLTGTVNCYRIRIGRYRIGITLERQTVEFVRVLPRKDLYRYFP